MDFINDLFDKIISKKSSNDPHSYLPLSDNEVVVKYHQNETTAAAATITDVYFNALDEPVFSYPSVEQANSAFLNSYWQYMTNYYGRPPRYRSDLYCAMFPVDIDNKEVDEHFTRRYWWMSVLHPLVCILTDNKKKEHYVVETKLYGQGVVYCEKYVELCIDWIIELAEQDETKKGQLHLEIKSLYAKSREQNQQVKLE
ncbi:MAG: hypothetical protein K2Q45_02390 [Nitrosomonas sp.]|nr:hypothetical protein [Nitrosomonas sp.]